MKVVVVNGPNLNLLGTREPEVYGRETLRDVETRLVAEAEGLGLQLECFQSNHEGAIVDQVHRAREEGWGSSS